MSESASESAKAIPQLTMQLVALLLVLNMRHSEGCMINVLKNCRKEILEFPEDFWGDLADALARREDGQVLSMPLSRLMPSIGRGVHELRFRDRAGIYRKEVM